MPTGYTAGVCDGTVTDFTTYALQCARAFGACIELRDDPIGPDIPEFKVLDLYFESAKKAEEKLKQFIQMSEVKLRKLHQKELEDGEENAKNYKDEQRKRRERYDLMLEKARKFSPPSIKHAEYAKFLVDQLVQSRDFDCGSDSETSDYWSKSVEKNKDFQVWRADKLSKLSARVKYRTEDLRKQKDLVESRNEWVRQLKSALGIN